MHRHSLGVAAFAFLLLSAPIAAAAAAPQEAAKPAPARKRGIVFKDEVDGLVQALTEDAKASGTSPGK